MRPPQTQIDHYHGAGLWGTETIDSRFRANVARVPDRLALADAPNRADFTDGAPGRLTYAELDRAVARVAALIPARAAGPGDSVVCKRQNSVQTGKNGKGW